MYNINGDVMFNDKEIEELNDKVYKLNKIIKVLCPHKTVTEAYNRYTGTFFMCDLCGGSIYDEKELLRNTKIRTGKCVFKKPKRRKK